jgi:hypothetical protein
MLFNFVWLIAFAIAHPKSPKGVSTPGFPFRGQG